MLRQDELQQLTAEQEVLATVKGGYTRLVWERMAGRRNEALDCCNYAMAAFKALPCDLDGIDRALKRARGVAVDAPAALEVPQTKSPQPKRRGLSKYYDEW